MSLVTVKLLFAGIAFAVVGRESVPEKSPALERQHCFSMKMTRGTPSLTSPLKLFYMSWHEHKCLFFKEIFVVTGIVFSFLARRCPEQRMRQVKLSSSVSKKYKYLEEIMYSNSLVKKILFLSVLILSLTPVYLLAEITPKVKSLGLKAPKQVLFVGNSYLYYGDSLHNHVVRLAKAADKENEKLYSYKSATISGSYLWHHNIESYLKPGALGLKTPFDVVVLQGHSTSQTTPEKRKDFLEKAEEFNELINNTGAKTALFMPWAYTEKHKKYTPEMLTMNRDGYTEAGNEIGALVIPAGLAFKVAYAKKPGIVLQKQYDGSHPDLLGTYLAACVTYAALYETSPVGNSYTYYGAIDPDTASFLQQVAWDTVTEFYGW